MNLELILFVIYEDEEYEFGEYVFLVFFLNGNMWMCVVYFLFLDVGLIKI